MSRCEPRRSSRDVERRKRGATITGLTRRSMLAGVAGALATWMSLGAARAGTPLPNTAGLRDHAARADLVYGAAIAAENWVVPECRALYEHEARVITTDLDLKFAALRPSPEVFAFGPADALVAWARSKGLLVRGHTLIWNESNGDWINRCSAREVARIFDEHIERVASRYAGRIHTWDVINEPFWPDHGKPGGYRQGPWYNALGPAYIPRALKRVRAIDPDVHLCINEAHCELENSWGNGIRPCLLRLITELRHAGIPLDAVGLQGHIQPSLPHDDAHYVAFLHSLAAQGVDLHITEFDVNDVEFPDAIPERDRLVADRATAFLDAVLSVPAVRAVVSWELQDRWSFYEHEALDKDPGAIRLPRPLPFDDEGRRKPLWSAMAAAFDRRAGA